MNKWTFDKTYSFYNLANLLNGGFVFLKYINSSYS